MASPCPPLVMKPALSNAVESGATAANTKPNNKMIMQRSGRACTWKSGDARALARSPLPHPLSKEVKLHDQAPLSE